MSGENFNKTNDSNVKSLDISIDQIMRDEMKRHNDHEINKENLNKFWVDSFCESLYQELRYEFHDGISRLIKQELRSGEKLDYSRKIRQLSAKSFKLVVDLNEGHWITPFRHPVKNLNMTLHEIFTTGLPGFQRNNTQVKPINGTKIKESVVEFVQEKIGDMKSVSIDFTEVERTSPTDDWSSESMCEYFITLKW